MFGYLVKIKEKYYPVIFFLASFLILLIALILCWNLELKYCFWILNIVQVIYILAIDKMYGIQNDTVVKGDKWFWMFGGELLLITALIFAASTMNSGIVLAAVILFLLALLFVGTVGLLWKFASHPPVLFIANLFGLAFTLVVLRSNLYMLSPNYAVAMQQIICSCLITYSISTLFIVGAKLSREDKIKKLYRL